MNIFLIVIGVYALVSAFYWLFRAYREEKKADTDTDDQFLMLGDSVVGLAICALCVHLY